MLTMLLKRYGRIQVVIVELPLPLTIEGKGQLYRDATHGSFLCQSPSYFPLRIRLFQDTKDFFKKETLTCVP